MGGGNQRGGPREGENNFPFNSDCMKKGYRKNTAIFVILYTATSITLNHIYLRFHFKDFWGFCSS